MIFNYITENGKRTSLRLMPAEVKAIKYIMNDDTNKAIKKYIGNKMPFAKGWPNDQSFTGFVREAIILDLLFILFVNERKQNG